MKQQPDYKNVTNYNSNSVSGNLNSKKNPSNSRSNSKNNKNASNNNNNNRSFSKKSKNLVMDKYMEREPKAINDIDLSPSQKFNSNDEEEYFNRKIMKEETKNDYLKSLPKLKKFKENSNSDSRK